jgi:hypothetical protein
MATMQLHDIIETTSEMKHFDDFSAVKVEFTTQGKYDKAPIYEKLDLYFKTPEQAEAFVLAISNTQARFVK